MFNKDQLNNIIDKINDIHNGLEYHHKIDHIGRLGLIMFNNSNTPISNDHINAIAKLHKFIRFYTNQNYNNNPQYLCILFDSSNNTKLDQYQQIMVDIIDIIGMIDPHQYRLTVEPNNINIKFKFLPNDVVTQQLYNKLKTPNNNVIFKHITNNKSLKFLFNINIVRITG